MAQTAIDSAHAGFLVPPPGTPFAFDGVLLGFDAGTWFSEPQGGQALDDFFQQVVAGVTGLPERLVRPRWQAEPPPLPASERTWCAVGLTTTVPQGPPAARYDSTAPPGLGHADQLDWEEFDLLCSFYGPEADRYAILLRQGLFVEPNRSFLSLLAIAFVTASGRTRLPAFTLMANYLRVDITLTFRRTIQTIYPILYLLSADLTVVAEGGVTSHRVGASE